MRNHPSNHLSRFSSSPYECFLWASPKCICEINRVGKHSITASILLFQRSLRAQIASFFWSSKLVLQNICSISELIKASNLLNLNHFWGATGHILELLTHRMRIFIHQPPYNHTCIIRFLHVELSSFPVHFADWQQPPSGKMQCVICMWYVQSLHRACIVYLFTVSVSHLPEVGPPGWITVTLCT